MEKPKTVWALIVLWLIAIFFFALQVWHYYSILFIDQLFTAIFSIEYISLFVFTNITIIIAIILIDSIIATRKWSWLVNIIVSFSFFFRYFLASFRSIYLMVYENKLALENNPPIHLFGWNISSLILPFILLAIFFLLLKPDVKSYFNQKIPGDQL